MLAAKLDAAGTQREPLIMRNARGVWSASDIGLRKPSGGAATFFGHGPMSRTLSAGRERIGSVIGHPRRHSREIWPAPRHRRDIVRHLRGPAWAR